MFLKFISVSIENFQSIGKSYLDLTSVGVCLVKGINNYEDRTKSNGSGKSTAFESVIWAIYGKTSSGIANPTNRYSSGGCMVDLKFMVDNQEFRIIRSINHSKYKTGLVLYNGSNDISGRNKTDTEKVIKDNVIKFSQDVFLSTVILSQGFANRISLLTPSGRKERIEILTETSATVDIFKDKFSKLKTEYGNLANSIQSDISYKTGSMDSFRKQIERLEQIINEVEESKKDYDLETAKRLVSDKESEQDIVNKKLSDTSSKLAELTSIISSQTRDMSRLNSEISKNREFVSKASGPSKVCPTCHQNISNELSQEIVSKYQEAIDSSMAMLNEINSKLLEAEGRKSKLSAYRTTLDGNLKDIKFDLSDLREEVERAAKVRDVTEDIASLEKTKKELSKLKKDIDKLQEDKSNADTNLGVVNNCLTLITKQFRGYLLQSIVDFMNSRLEDYSGKLFSNSSDIIRLEVDESKLDIYLNDAIYDTLSGGERKKVDIALVLTQRDLAMNIAGTSSNILVLDETLEGLDEYATNVTLEMIVEKVQEIDSMFIISHNDYTIQYDSIMTVTKSSDRISSISVS